MINKVNYSSKDIDTIIYLQKFLKNQINIKKKTPK